MKIFNINRVYRETAPDAEGHVAVPGSAPAAANEEPAPEPEAIAPDEGQDTIPEDDNLWDALSKDMDEPDDEPEPEDSPSEEALAEPEPEVTTPEAPAEPDAEPEAETPAEPVAADTATPAEEPVVQPTPEEPEPEPTPQVSDEDRQKAYDTRKADIETRLTEKFGLNESEALQLVTNPGEAFPKISARMFTDMWLAVESLIDQRLPTVIERTTQEMKVRDEKVVDFFKAWPKLNQKDHGAQVAQVAQVFGQINKGATEEEVIKHVGLQVMMMNGFAPDFETVNTPAGEVATPEAETPATPHRPAAVNGVTQTPQQSSGNLYTDMAEELLEDED